MALGRCPSQKQGNFDFGGCGGPQPPAGKQVAPVQLRNRDLMAAIRRVATPLVASRGRPSAEARRPVYPIGDLRSLELIPYAAR